ncbi:cytidylyl-2-hydroxypropylphosphonate hydrolase [Streptomyces sp. 4N509B]|uniref:cytidylyl-2-hydroxypropylphosphonate hydrolase n=1 Tax=Streptomyces sp. 4N509B TaxID=3457413 RepID=UPI003FD28CB3
MTTGTNGAGPAHRWRPGDHVLWRYRAHHPTGVGVPVVGDPAAGPPAAGGRAAGAFHICRPVTVVEDTPERLVVWLAPGTECVKPELLDGTPIHSEPLVTRYTKPRAAVRTSWSGAGVLKLACPDEPWSVWLFWDRHWRFKNWYVNLEEPRRRWAGGVDSEDHFLDIVVYPDRRWEWRDEDEFAQAQQAGLLDAEQAARVHAAGRAAVRLISRWGRPFCEEWTGWRPEPEWSIPELPADWDRQGGARRTPQPRPAS